MMSLFDQLEPGAKVWFDTAHAKNVAEYQKAGLPAPGLPSIDGVSACSQAISLKRIADALEKMEKHLAPQIVEVKTAPANLGDWINGKTDEPPEFMKP